MPETAKPILILGSLNMDLVARCQRLPHLGETVFGDDFFTAAGGKGANQAVAAARLGAHVTMAGCVGTDQFGSELIGGLVSAGMDTSCVDKVDRATGTALITIDANGANTIVVISGANTACDTALAERALARFRMPGVLLLQHEIPEQTNAYAIHAAQSAGWTIILNPAPSRPVDPALLPLIDIIVPNETEAAGISGRIVTNRQEALAAARQLLDLGARAVLVTLGADGAVYCNGSEKLHCPAVVVRAVDTTAAGDAYIGALATALAEERSLPDSLGFAAAAAALSVTRLGAQPSLATGEELTDFIARFGTPAVERISP